MRLIDADALLKTGPFTKCGGDLSGYTEGYLDCAEEAREAVKAAESKVSKWVVRRSNFNWWYECFKCGAYRPRNRYNQEFSSRYCPDCGLPMECTEELPEDCCE